jgi:hypothetical protein
MNKRCDECEQNSREKFAVKASHRIFAIRPKIFYKLS